MKGIFEFTLEDGRAVGFKFGTYAMAVACDKDKCALDTFFTRIGLGGGKKREIRTLSLLHLWYGAAVNYYEHIDKEVNFTASHVDDWISEIGYEKMMETYQKALTQYVPKNSTAPEMAGQQMN
jgi:hypothetical protein